MKNPPILISVIGFFAALAGFAYFFFGLRVLGFDWFGVLGDLPKYESAGLWGWLAIFAGVIWILAAVGLWGLQPWARMFAIIIAGFQPLRGGPRLLQFPGLRGRVRVGDHAPDHALVPEHGRSQVRLLRRRNADGFTLGA